MPVFISHRHTDTSKATHIYGRLTTAGIECYLDVVDPESRATKNITALISKRILESTHLLAVVSHSTALSWWVPFEVGEATISQRKICTYNVSFIGLPEYLAEWPIMSKDAHLDYFISEYKRETSHSKQRVLAMSQGARTRILNESAVEDFHSTMKMRIKRGY